MLQRLEVQALRGSTEKLTLAFEKGKKITIVYGQNAPGKSTICDAFELLCKGKVGSLEGKGLGKTEAYWHSTGKSPADLSVSLITTKGRWQAKVSKSKAVVTPDAGRPQAEILRRNQIQKLIADQPKTRFDAIRPFLDTELVEVSENHLRRLIEQEKAARETAVARIEENRVAVENFWKEVGIPKPGALQWARLEIKKGTSQLQTDISQLETIIKQIESLNTEKERLDRYSEELAKADASHRISSEKVVEEQTKVSDKVGDLIGILEAAQRYFSLHDKIDVCPLCGSSEFVTDLPKRINDQLEAIRALSQAVKSKVVSNSTLEFAKKQFNKQAEIFLTSCKTVAASIKSYGLPQGLAWPQDLLKSKEVFSTSDDDSDIQLISAKDLASKAMTFLDIAKSGCEKRKEKKGFIQTLNRAVETYDNNYATQQELDLLVPRMEKALSEIEEERRLFVDDILKKIATRVGTLYEKIHPDEGLSKISLLLDPDKRASLEILCPFPGAKEVPPGAYLSDSHLDTLGLCIWLAIAELGDVGNLILVLDDAVMSVDEPHVERVIELLYELGPQFRHCIYATHYRPWREKYRWGWLKNGECQFVELLPWKHEKGIKHSKHLPPLEELRKLLSAELPNSQLACAGAAVILEAVLYFLTQLYECSVPMRRGNPTIGDLLPSIKGKLRSALKIERLETGADEFAIYKEYSLAPVLDELEKIAQARNVFGCHFNDLSYQLPEEDAIRFANAVLVLGDYLIDIDCGWPRSDKSGSYWVNSKKTRRLHPLRQPS